MALIGGPLLVGVSAWFLFRLTAGTDEAGGKAAARIMGVISLAVVSFVGFAGLPAYGAGLYTLALMIWCLMLVTPFVLLAAIAVGAVAWLRNRAKRPTHSN